MTGSDSLDRSYKAGSWDLRKEERRLRQNEISFPDRRKDERRLTMLQDHYDMRVGTVNWVDKPGLDE